MKRLIVISLILLAGNVLAQQTPIYSQFVMHDYLINPAIVGTRDFYDVKMSNRLQWVGIDEAPRTSVLSANGPLKTRKMGFGGYFLNDHAGHIKQQALYLSYSYIVSMAGGVKLSFGLSSGLQAYTVDGTKLNLNETGDQILSNGLQTSWLPDGTFGMMFFTDRLKAGFSINQLYGSKMNFFKDGNVGTAKLTQHYNLHGSYLIGSSEKELNFEPYLLLKFVQPTPMQFDVGFRAIYKQKLWLGGSMRSNESFSVLFGFIFRDNLTFGYSYDIITSDIGIRAKQSHEITLGIKMKRALPKKK